MKQIEDFLTEWRELTEQGDNRLVAQLIGKSETIASRILNGKQKPTQIEIAKIEAYFLPRKQARMDLTKGGAK